MGLNRLDPDSLSLDMIDFKNKINYPDRIQSEDISDLINNLIKADGLRNMDIHTLNEYAMKMSAYALYVQVEKNKLKTKYDWYEANIKYIVGNNLPEAYGYGFVEKDHCIRSLNPSAQTMEEKKLLIQAKLNMLDGLAEKIHFIVNNIKSIVYSRGKVTNNEY